MKSLLFVGLAISTVLVSFNCPLFNFALFTRLEPQWQRLLMIKFRVPAPSLKTDTETCNSDFTDNTVSVSATSREAWIMVALESRPRQIATPHPPPMMIWTSPGRLVTSRTLSQASGNPSLLESLPVSSTTRKPTASASTPWLTPLVSTISSWRT